MPETTLYFRPTLSKLEDIVLDAVVSESHDAEMEITEFPVERGAQISDHARLKPERLTLEAIVSNTPLSREQQARKVEVTGGGSIFSTADKERPAGIAGPAELAYARLRDLMVQAQLVSVVTGLRVYDDLIIESLSVPRRAATGDALEFSVRLKTIRLVNNKVTTIRVSKTKEPRAHSKKDQGKVPAQEKSLLVSGLDELGVTKRLGVPPE